MTPNEAARRYVEADHTGDADEQLRAFVALVAAVRHEHQVTEPDFDRLYRALLAVAPPAVRMAVSGKLTTISCAHAEQELVMREVGYWVGVAVTAMAPDSGTEASSTPVTLPGLTDTQQ